MVFGLCLSLGSCTSTACYFLRHHARAGTAQSLFPGWNPDWRELSAFSDSKRARGADCCHHSPQPGGNKSELVEHLESLERMGLIAEWHDRKFDGRGTAGSSVSENWISQTPFCCRSASTLSIRNTGLKRFWCPWPESNQHSLRNSILSRARLPIPPQGLFGPLPERQGREAGGI